MRLFLVPLCAALLSPAARADPTQAEQLPAGFALSLGVGSAYGFVGGRLEFLLGPVAVFGAYGVNVLQPLTAQGGVYGGGLRFLSSHDHGLFVSGQFMYSEAGGGDPRDEGGSSQEENFMYGVTAGWRFLLARHFFIEAGAGLLLRDRRTTLIMPPRRLEQMLKPDRRIFPDADLGFGVTF